MGAILANTALVGALQLGLPTNESKFFCTVRVSYRVKREVPFQALESKLLFHTSVIFSLRVNDGKVWTASLTVVVVRLVTRGLKMASLQALKQSLCFWVDHVDLFFVLLPLQMRFHNTYMLLSLS